jgi:micrococcal nuclease
VLAATLYSVLVLGVVDGDTFNASLTVWPDVQVVTAVRLAGVDTPELRGKCAAETVAAQAARKRLAELLTGKLVTISAVKPDKYRGRVDARVTVDGQDVAQQLLAEGHARPYAGGARLGWCP